MDSVSRPFSPMRTEAERLLAEAREHHLHLRLLGAIAFQLHCPKYITLSTKLGRLISDIDFAAYGKERTQINHMMRELRYVENLEIAAFVSHRRMIWDNKSNGFHVDIFFDKLEMNHDIPFAGRLELQESTIPLSDLLLEKMQIVNINEKDIVDAIMLLREHDVGGAAPETIDARYLSTLLSNDWGFCHTVTDNLRKVKDRLAAYELDEDDRADVSAKIYKLVGIIENEPKTAAWKLRAKLGTRSKWYREVEEIARGT